MDVLRRITTRLSSMTPTERAEAGREKRTPILTVFGIVNRVKADLSDLGEFYRFFGDFKAVDCVTGEEHVAPQAIFPGVLQDLLVGQMNGDVSAVEFAGTLGVEPDKGSTRPGVGYKWFFEPLMKPASSDRMAQIEAQIAKSLPKPVIEKSPAKGK